MHRSIVHKQLFIVRDMSQQDKWDWDTFINTFIYYYIKLPNILKYYILQISD